MGFPDGTLSDDAWQRVLAGDAPGAPLYAPLLAGGARGLVLGRIAQTLDGRIADAAGASRWISGQRDILHTHRLRALCDAVATHAALLAKGDDATFQNKVHLSMEAAGFDAKA